MALLALPLCQICVINPVCSRLEVVTCQVRRGFSPSRATHQHFALVVCSNSCACVLSTGHDYRIAKSSCNPAQCAMSFFLCNLFMGRLFNSTGHRFLAVSIASSRCGFMARQGISDFLAQTSKVAYDTSCQSLIPPRLSANRRSPSI